MNEILFTASNISKNFAKTLALKNVDLQVRSGEIVGLIGENGAGKSTLLKIIIGSQPPSEGKMIMNGINYNPNSTMEGNRLGVGMVFQEQSLVGNLTVAQNIFFGHEKMFKKYGFIRWSKMNQKAFEILENIGCSHINPKKKVIDLNFATRQMVEIAKVVNLVHSSNTKNCLILLDEPTSVLNGEEIGQLFSEMIKLKANGHGVVFVSHRLDEVLEISDRIYVYKDGENAGNMSSKEADEKKLYSLMVGKTSSGEYYSIDKQLKASDDVILKVSNLGLYGVFKNITFELHKGEILGFCGVVGSGKEEICSVISGDEKPDYGSIFVKNKKLSFGSPSDAHKNNILMVPKERFEEGIVDQMSVADNILLSSFRLPGTRSFISLKKSISIAKYWISALRIKTLDYAESLVQLSGGNQQKVVFARALNSKCDIIILNHPTRGVDIGAKEEIYVLIRSAVAEGKSVILLGDTIDECINMCHRVIVMRDGLVTKEFDTTSVKPDQSEIIKFMM